MTAITTTEATTDRFAEDHAEPTVALKRRTIDSVLIGFGAVFTVVLLVAGALLTWGSNFAADYVDDELSSQNIAFPPAAALEEEGRTDLVKYADESVNTGPEAEAYASFINGHLHGHRRRRHLRRPRHPRAGSQRRRRDGGRRWR